MANEEHLKILLQGTESWNSWREEHSDVRPDLAGANLASVNLGNANLTYTNLGGADLTGAYLRNADLRGANLIGAYLYGGNLRGANLNGAYLVAGDLFFTDHSGANFSDANLRGVSDKPKNRASTRFRRPRQKRAGRRRPPPRADGKR